MEKKAVQFSKELVSDIFYIERIDKRRKNDLFYSEKDVIGFQIDFQRSAERKAARRQLSRNKSDGAVHSSTNRDDEEESLNEWPKSKTLSKSSKKKGRSKTASVTTRGRRYSNDDAKEYTPRPCDESSKAKAKTQGKNASAMVKCLAIVSKDEESAVANATTSTPNNDSTGARRAKRQEDILLKTAMTLCRTTQGQAGSDGLDATRDRSNVSLESWTQDKLLQKAKQWKERVALTVSNNLVALSTEMETEEKKEASPVPIKKEVSPMQIKKEVADFDFMTLCRTTNFNGSTGGLDATRDRSRISLEPWSQDLPLSKAKQWKEG